MNVDETDLPGLGRRKDFMTASGRRIGVVELREGQTELIVSTWDDPDTCQASIPAGDTNVFTLVGDVERVSAEAVMVIPIIAALTRPLS